MRLPACCLFVLLLAVPARAACGPPWLGADVSMLPVLEAAGVSFASAEGQPADVLALLRRQGATVVRLRLWHTPPDTPEGRSGRLDAALALARRARAAGLCVGLTLHVSDTWADPSAQAKPQAWQALPFATLVDSVRAYTARVTGAFAAQGTPLAFVSTGNEITGGFLWPEGRVGGPFDTPAQWRQLGLLLKAAGEGVRAGAPEAAVVLHLDRGGDAAGVRWFLDHARAESVAFDAVGLSYYPWWHGTPNALDAALDAVATRYRVPVFVAETAYPWTTSWNDATHNPVGTQPLAAFPATPEGQAAFVRDVRARVNRTADGLGAGLLYWAPEWTTAAGVGSPWENLAAFDFRGRELSVLRFLGPATGTASTAPRPSLQLALSPNPTSADATLRVSGAEGPWEAVVVDALGRRVAAYAGKATDELRLPARAAGAYLVHVTTADGRRATTRLVVQPH